MGHATKKHHNQLVDVDCEVMHETPDAYKISDGMHHCWVPKSLAQDNGDGTVSMPEWLAKDKRLI